MSNITYRVRLILGLLGLAFIASACSQAIPADIINQINACITTDGIPSYLIDHRTASYEFFGCSYP